MLIIVGAIYAAVMAAQGAVVFVTAYFGLRLFKTRNLFAKIAAMFLSWAAWIAVTLVGYGLLGGSFGLMQGFGLILILCVTATASSLLYLLAWACWPLIRRTRTVEVDQVF